MMPRFMVPPVTMSPMRWKKRIDAEIEAWREFKAKQSD
jgi:hypothetical protein